jgi:hypothetical protein
MRKNVVILTSGLSGSSVLTGLIARGGYWIGNETFSKPDYETFENQELIDLNKTLFREAEYTGNYAFEVSTNAVTRIAGLYSRIDCGAYRSFLERCNDHQPWLWKDPRLWMTIRFWKNLLELDRCVFLLLTRDMTQVWMSALLRRQILSYRSVRSYEHNINRTILEFLHDNGLRYLHMRYEDLIEKPADTIGQLNAYLDSTLTVEDLRAIYKGPLYKSPRYSFRRQFKAMLIYYKNYFERLDIVG